MASELSPLQEADPKALDELFARDPLKLTHADRDVIVSEIRKQRVRWLALGGESGEKKSEAKAKKQLTKEQVTGLLNNGLDLEL